MPKQPKVYKKRTAKNIPRKANQNYFQIGLVYLRELFIEAAQINGVPQLTEEMLLFIRSKQFRKIIIKENIKIITKIFLSDETKK